MFQPDCSSYCPYCNSTILMIFRPCRLSHDPRPSILLEGCLNRQKDGSSSSRWQHITHYRLDQLVILPHPTSDINKSRPSMLCPGEIQKAQPCQAFLHSPLADSRAHRPPPNLRPIESPHKEFICLFLPSSLRQFRKLPKLEADRLLKRSSHSPSLSSIHRMCEPANKAFWSSCRGGAVLPELPPNCNAQLGCSVVLYSISLPPSVAPITVLPKQTAG
ncbi:hypothetical protein BKA65DRAFT_33808 [Rhexocercosporidium sp. MPI-PUGE-AT-0058]|nr:hypothetical protein BKA65DRAFT_33808 [Rhexocercosporidium sp. MPI-PUGE-AT-0058]